MTAMAAQIPSQMHNSHLGVPALPSIHLTDGSTQQQTMSMGGASGGERRVRSVKGVVSVQNTKDDGSGADTIAPHHHKIESTGGQASGMSPAAAVDKYRAVLSDYEIEEIHAYPEVWFIGPGARKIAATRDAAHNFGYDDEKGRYRSVKGDHIAYRYEVLRGLGKGSFGDVLRCMDHKTGRQVACKIIRNERRFHKQAKSEIEILDLLRQNDRRDQHNVIHMVEYFVFRGHICITFELLDSDLYNALRRRSFRGFEPRVIEDVARSLVATLRVLRRNRIIHCDLKPENILFKNNETAAIKVIDFGSSCFLTGKVHSYIQSRFYRSPEVILGLSYSMPIDMCPSAAF